MRDGAAGMLPLDALERRLVDGWQRGFPLVERPYATIAASLGASEREVLDAVARRLADGVFSRVGAVFRPGAIGASTLAAIAVPPARLDAVAAGDRLSIDIEVGALDAQAAAHVAERLRGFIHVERVLMSTRIFAGEARA